MWLFSQRGFFSIVQNINDPNSLIVRARVSGDIEKYWPHATVIATPDSDYLYRAVLRKEEVALVIIKMVMDIDYGNFKLSIKDRRRSPWYATVWQTMLTMQSEFMKKEKPNGKKGRDQRGID